MVFHSSGSTVRTGKRQLRCLLWVVLSFLSTKRLTLVDVDAPIRLSEEAQDAAVTVPKATMLSQTISCVCGLLVSSPSECMSPLLTTLVRQ